MVVGRKSEQIKIYYHTIKEMLRKYQIDDIAKYGEPIIPYLIKALGDSNKYVRVGAAEALGELDNASAVPALIKAFGDVSEHVRETAKEALIYMGKNAVLGLLEALEDDKPKIRKNAVEALISINEPSLATLINVVGGNKNKKEAVKIMSSIVKSRIDIKKKDIGKKEKQEITGDGELLKGETVKPPSKERAKKIKQRIKRCLS